MLSSLHRRDRNRRSTSPSRVQCFRCLALKHPIWTLKWPVDKFPPLDAFVWDIPPAQTASARHQRDYECQRWDGRLRGDESTCSFDGLCCKERWKSRKGRIQSRVCRNLAGLGARRRLGRLQELEDERVLETRWAEKDREIAR